jgi:hypothetical protein
MVVAALSSGDPEANRALTALLDADELSEP